MAVTGVNVTYGDYVFKPAPNVSYERETYAIKNNGNIIGGVYTISLEGTLIPEATGEGGAVNVFRSQEALHSAFTGNYREFIAEFLGDASCSGTVISGRPLVNSISISSPDYYTKRADYSISLGFAASSLSGTDDYLGEGLNLEDAQTNYSFSYINKPKKYYGVEFPPVLEISRSVSAVGQTISTGELGNGTALCVSGLTNAINYVTGVATTELNSMEVNGLLSLGTAVNYGYKTYLTERSVSQDETAASFSADDTFIAIATGMPNAGMKNLPSGVTNGPQSGFVPLGDYPVNDTFNLNVEKSNQDGIAKVSMDGVVKGYPSYSLMDGSFTLVAEEGGFDTARNYTKFCLDSGIFATRAGMAYSGAIAGTLTGVAGTPFNSSPLSETYGYNIEEGTVTYNIAFDNRSAHCVTGVISETINVTKKRPTDVYAEIKILGRAAGPLLQDIGTKTAFTQDLSIAAAVVPSTGCATGDNYFDAAPTAQYDAIVDQLEQSISGDGNTIFRTADNETFDVKTGRYTRQASWIYTSCPS
tara:strand:+ start:7352 stop:8944 length:1593 start_codon:yes stop_codon:yes gene_type:complete